MSKATVTPMRAQSQPTCYQLVKSWKAIWQAKLDGPHRQLLDAINNHVALFPTARQTEVLARVERTISQVHEPMELQVLIRRASRVLEHPRAVKEA